MKHILTLILTLTLLGCADPAFDRYVQSRQAAIAGMPNGQAKYEAQLILDQQIYADKKRQQAQAGAAMAAGLAGAAAGAAAAAEANRRVYVVPVYQPYYTPYYWGY